MHHDIRPLDRSGFSVLQWSNKAALNVIIYLRWLLFSRFSFHVISLCLQGHVGSGLGRCSDRGCLGCLACVYSRWQPRPGSQPTDRGHCDFCSTAITAPRMIFSLAHKCGSNNETLALQCSFGRDQSSSRSIRQAKQKSKQNHLLVLHSQYGFSRPCPLQYRWCCLQACLEVHSGYFFKQVPWAGGLRFELYK